ncbi:hypothetical protein ACLM5H_05645 [Fredinandcohnia humi]
MIFLIDSQIIIDALLQGLLPVFDAFKPLLIWVVLPGIITTMIFKSKEGYTVGAILGLLLAFTIGPFSN